MGVADFVEQFVAVATFRIVDCGVMLRVKLILECVSLVL